MTSKDSTTSFIFPCFSSSSGRRAGACLARVLLVPLAALLLPGRESCLRRSIAPPARVHLRRCFVLLSSSRSHRAGRVETHLRVFLSHSLSTFSSPPPARRRSRHPTLCFFFFFFFLTDSSHTRLGTQAGCERAFTVAPSSNGSDSDSVRGQGRDWQLYTGSSDSNEPPTADVGGSPTPPWQRGEPKLRRV